MFDVRTYGNDPLPGDPPPPAKTFTQEDVNRIMAEEKRKTQANLKAINDELTNLRSSAQLTEEERNTLSSRIAELEQQTMTKDEMARRDTEKLKKAADEQVKALTTERDSYRGLFESNLIDAQLAAAATAHKALSVEQISAFLKGNTKVKYVNENGVPNYQVEVSLPDKDKDGRPITLTASPDEVIKRMKDLPDRFGNLFINESNAGLGGNNSQGRGSSPPEFRPGMSMEEYKKIRARLKG